MRISDWSSDVCSSDLGAAAAGEIQAALALALRRVAPGEISRCLLVVAGQRLVGRVGDTVAQRLQVEHAEQRVAAADVDRKSVVEGKSVSVRVDLGGRRIIKKKKNTYREVQP